MMNKGFTLFIAIVVMGTLLLVASGVVNLAVKQTLISSAASQSQAAFYAADSGMECALFWDVKHNSFSTTTTSNIECNGQTINGVGGTDLNTFDFNFAPQLFCARVEVHKKEVGSNEVTAIYANGYNICGDYPHPTRRVQRTVSAVYGLGL